MFIIFFRFYKSRFTYIYFLERVLKSKTSELTDSANLSASDFNKKELIIPSHQHKMHFSK